MKTTVSFLLVALVLGGSFAAYEVVKRIGEVDRLKGRIEELEEISEISCQNLAAGASGAYLLDGEWDNRPCYRHNGWYLYWSETGWVIGADLGGRPCWFGEQNGPSGVYEADRSGMPKITITIIGRAK